MPEEVPYDPLNPHPWYRFMSANHPVYYDQQVKMWYAFRYQEVQQVLTDPETFSSKGASGGGLVGGSFLAMDPPEHHKYRALVNQAFTSRRIAQLEPRIAVLANQLLDAVSSTGQLDVIADLSYPLAAVVIAELLGVPAEDRDLFKPWSDAIVAEFELHTQDQYFAAQQRVADYLLPLVEQRCLEPQNDLLSTLLSAEVAGERLTTREILAIAIVLLVAGHQTTMHLIGNALYAFTESAGMLDELRADPSLIPGAIEEVLRYYPPVAGDARIVAVDTRLAGTDLVAGSVIVASMASANRDESVFVDPERFNIRRTPNRHLSFGQGIHFCLGAPLARLQAKVAVTLMLERLPGLQRIADRPAQIIMKPGGHRQNTGQMPLGFVPQVS